MASGDNEELLGKGISGVASYSKVLAIREPETFAIYDARVAVSLNAIQLIAGCPDGWFFPYLPGRNKITGDTIGNRGFSTCTKFKSEAVLKRHPDWKLIPRRSSYAQYLELLHTLHQEMPEISIQEMEMALFADAEALAQILIDVSTQKS